MGIARWRNWAASLLAVVMLSTALAVPASAQGIDPPGGISADDIGGGVASEEA